MDLRLDRAEFNEENEHPPSTTFDYYLYYCSFLMGKDHWFCYMPLLNRRADGTSMFYPGSEWCGDWKPSAEACPNGEIERP
jgi:hypothetical protein